MTEEKFVLALPCGCGNKTGQKRRCDRLVWLRQYRLEYRSQDGIMRICWRFCPRRRSTALGCGVAILLLYGLAELGVRPSTSDRSRANNKNEAENPANVCADWPAYSGAARKDWQKTSRREVAVEGPGEHGTAVKMPTDLPTQQRLDKLYRANGYSGLVSDQIRLNRTVPDIRHAGCRGQRHLARLPTASVILAFHQEHLSVLLRSCHSVINRSPPELLTEVVLVDDFSTKPDLGEPLRAYLATNLPKVKLIRTKVSWTKLTTPINETLWPTFSAAKD